MAMTAEEICKRQRENGNKEMYLRLKGSFWQTYDGGAFAIARVTGYQVIRLKTIDRYQLGFPLVAIDRVLTTMKEKGLTVKDHQEGDTLITFSGGDPTPDNHLVTTEGELTADDNADYQELKSVRKELLGINLADESLTFSTLLATIRNLQIRCLAHMQI